METEDDGMNIEEAITLEEKLFKRRMDLRRTKGHDYANAQNIHLNFDVMSKLCELLNVDVKTPYGCAIYNKLLKLQRETNLLFSGKTPSNEAILDTLLDLANYNDLEVEMLIRDGVIKI